MQSLTKILRHLSFLHKGFVSVEFFISHLMLVFNPLKILMTFYQVQHGLEKCFYPGKLVQAGMKQAREEEWGIFDQGKKDYSLVICMPLFSNM